MIGPKDVRARDLPDPDGAKCGVPTYFWGMAPEGLATRRQLTEQGLRPGGQDITLARANRARQELAMTRHGMDPSEADASDIGDPGPQWEWEGFDR